MRFFHLTAHSFWCDEFLAISLGKLRLSKMFGWVFVNDAHPPLFYTLVHYLLKLGKSEFLLRILPALFGIAALVVFYLFLKRFWKGNILLPLALFSLSPAAILWSQILKSYSALTLFSLLSAYSFFSLKETKRPLCALGWFLSTATLLYLHNYGILVFAAEIIVALFSGSNLSKKIWLPTAIAIFLAYIPYLSGPIISQIHFAQGATHSVTNPFVRLAYASFYFIFGETLNPLNLKFVLPGILFAFFFFRGLFSRKSNDVKLFYSVLMSAGVLMIFLIPTTIPQNLIHLQPFFFLMVSASVDEFLPKRKTRLLVTFLIPLFLLPSLCYYCRGDSLQYHDVSKLIPYRQTSQEIEKTEIPGEVILFTGDSRDRRFAQFFSPYSAWDWYYRGGLPLTEINSAATNDLAGMLTKITGDYRGFWLLLQYGSDRDWNETIKSFFFKLEQKGEMVRLTENKMLRNDSFLARLRGKPEPRYYFLEIYHFRKHDAPSRIPHDH